MTKTPPMPPMRLSGLEPVTLQDDHLFVNIGERTSVTGSKAFARMILAGQFEEALAVARQQVDNGAQVIDVSMGEAMPDSRAARVRFLNLIAAEPEIARAVVVITASQSQLPKKANVARIVDHEEAVATHVPMVSRILHLLMVDIMAVGAAMRRNGPSTSAAVDLTSHTR